MENRIDIRPIKQIFPEAKDVIEYAFTLEGKDYFQFSDISTIPGSRYFASVEYQNELAMRCNRDFLQAHLEARKEVKAKLNGMSFVDFRVENFVKTMNEVDELDKIMEERLSWIHEPQIAAKLLSVVFFTADENPNRHDYVSGSKKAKIFLDAQKKDEHLDFFLSKPIAKLMPWISSLGLDFPEYCRLTAEITANHISSITQMLSEESKKAELFKSLMLQAAEVLESQKQES